ncbi:hypothetical protein QJS04_geneDACA003026 [Acorus gramineus]|uniref:Serine aminopeptidase S33 domain-containing protein n=1 Tax=Acorus gramineus TaxID=55184 RepID=A0AAV9BVW2_ACOGR|nr:hypothetical protein QJS04_geneDACA003026 [Acorus gramineus]
MKSKLEGVDESLLRLLNTTSLEEVAERRRVREAFREVQLGIDHCLFKFIISHVVTKLFSVVDECSEVFLKFRPGITSSCSEDRGGTARKIASSGYGVFAMDYPGFGLSEGLHGYIPSFDSIVNDVIEHFSKIKENPEYQSLPSYLFGQSMGGAVALNVHFKQPNAWSGAILLAPMCKIADDVEPSWILKQILISVAKILPKSKLVPDRDLAEMAFKDPKKIKMAAYNVIAYKDRPRLGTALELLNTTDEIDGRLENVSLPLLILHGEGDIVTDPSVSKALYEKAKSSDKKLLLYNDACHALLEGEYDEIILRVLEDIVSWLDEHSSSRITPS